jgi:hypothetical protein
VSELDTSVFVIPRSYVKNGLDRYVVLNRVAKSVINDRRGEHAEFVFTCEGRPVTKIYNSGWKAARRRAARRYAGEFGRACPDGFRAARVHDLKIPTVIGCGSPASASRIAGSSWATSPVMSPRIIRRRRSER